MVHYLLSVGLSVALLLFLTHIQGTSCRPPRQKSDFIRLLLERRATVYSEFFYEGFIFGETLHQ